MGDTKILPIILDCLARHEQGLKPVVILDAGFAWRGNLALLKERGYSCLINITRRRRTKYADAFEKEIFEALPGRSDDERVEVKKIADPEDPASQPDDKQKRVFQMLGIEWESTFPTKETEIPDLRDCSAFGTTP
jgi:hypothetical protein